MPKIVNEKKQPQFKWISGIRYPIDKPDLLCHLELFRNAPNFQAHPDEIRDNDGNQYFYTGTGRFEHCKIISQILYPKAMEWHYWSEQIERKACECPWLAISGPGASGKSTAIGDYALKWWMIAPTESAVIIASKTIESSKKRIWREIARFYSLFSNLIGGYRHAVIGSSPRPYICPIVGAERKKDEAHGLFVTALHGKELEKEIGYVKGFHPKRILVIADEADVLEDGGQALVDTFTDNLRTGTVESQIILLGNDPSLFNALGDAMQPEIGKPLTLENLEWKSAKGWDCLRLDAWDSPNVKTPGKWTGLVGQRDIDDLVRRKGENSPSVWIQLHGLHPPEGADNSVLSEATLIRFHAFEKVTWATNFTTSAALDPGFGGDACILRLFKRGNDTSRKLKIAVGPPIQIPIQADALAEPAEYQIARTVIGFCKANGVPPEEFAIGSAGIGRGTASVIKREWSPRIIEVQEGGSPSSRIVSEEHPVPATQEYDRKVTELWFQIREFVEADMLRELDRETAVQLCARTYEDLGTGGRRKISIQKKDKMLHSPNEADALAIGIENICLKGIFPTVQTPVKEQATQDQNKNIEAYDWDSNDLAYSDPLLDVIDF